MVAHTATNEANPRHRHTCATASAEKRRASRTKAAEGENFIRAEIGGLVRLFVSVLSHPE
jgi:hypothetical protein